MVSCDLYLLTKFRHLVPVIYITACKSLSEDAICEGSAYNLPMGKKGAILMLVAVVLWAASPALPCLAPAPCHSCCRMMMMMDCDSAMIAAHPCCQMHSSTAVPPGQIAVTSLPTGSSQTPVAVNLPDLSQGDARGPNPSKAPPPRSLSGASTILRI